MGENTRKRIRVGGEAMRREDAETGRTVMKWKWTTGEDEEDQKGRWRDGIKEHVKGKKLAGREMVNKANGGNAQRY